MFSYPTDEQVTAGLGDKFLTCFVDAVDAARGDYAEFRQWRPAWFPSFTNRFTSNFVHERVWAHMVDGLDEHADVVIVDKEPHREMTVGGKYVMRVKRHSEADRIRSYPDVGSPELLGTEARPRRAGEDQPRHRVHLGSGRTRRQGSGTLAPRRSGQASGVGDPIPESTRQCQPHRLGPDRAHRSDAGPEHDPEARRRHRGDWQLMSTLGDVIVAARKAAGITQEELCDRLVVTQAALSRYENNLREPDHLMLDKLADALDLSVEFLTHEFRLQGAIAADAHMRRQRTTKASDWKRAEARLNLLRMHSSYLLDRVPMNTDLHVPTFDPDDTTAADAARLIRAQWRLPIGPIRGLTRWLESAGVIVVEEELGTRRIDGMSQWASAFPVILINEALPTDRKRLTLAHELGHLVLHNQWIDADVEVQANDFAAELLMPEHLIKPQLRTVTLGKLADLKAEWGVSMAALIERAYHLGRLANDERQKLYRAMNARGWRTKEPGSDGIPPEPPRLSSTIGNTLRQAGLSDDDIAAIAGYRSPYPGQWFAPEQRSLRSV